ncbi:MAG: ABC transporter permease, partial [Actinomycetota bacterium]|nr:ABC transporter permease [Actinomycetota bacterium]
MTVARRFLADRRRGFLWWSLGVLVTVGLTVAVWPSVRGQQQFEDLVRDLPPAVRALFGAQDGIPFTSPAGYLHGRLFSSLLPLLLVVFGIGLGARAVGGAEEDGTLELVLAHPVSRARVAFQRYGAVVVLILGLTAVALAALVAVAPAVGLLDDVAPAR